MSNSDHAPLTSLSLFFAAKKPHSFCVTLRHTFPFMLSAANLGLEDTNASQFFITVAPAASLDGYHTCFGKVLRGFSTVKEVRCWCVVSAGF